MRATSEWVTFLESQMDSDDPDISQAANDALFTTLLSERDWAYDKRVAEEEIRLEAREEAAERVRLKTMGDAGTIELIALSDIAKREVPAWLVPGLFMESNVCVFAGTGGLGKSAFMLGLSLALATGSDFFGTPLTQAKVLYVAGEGGSGFKSRIDSWKMSTGLEPDDGHFFLVESGVNLSDPRSVTSLAKVIAQHDFKLIVLDTFSQLSYVENENDNAQVAKVMRHAKQLRDANPGASVVIIHHVNKSAGNLRGASAMRDNVDTLVMAKPHDAKDDAKGFYLSTHVHDGGKQKDGEPVKLEGFSLIGLGESVIVRKGDAPRRDKSIAESEAAILALLRDGAEYRTAAITSQLEADHPKTAIERALAALVTSGALTKPKKGVYTLTKEDD